VLYAFVGVVYFFATTALHWASGTHPLGTFHREVLIASFLAPYAVGLIHYLDRSAAQAMKSFFPALRDPDSYGALSYILTTLPPRLALLGGLMGLAVGFVLVVGAVLLVPLPATAGPARPDLFTLLVVGFGQLFGTGSTTASYALTLAVLILNWWVGGVLILHTVRRLTLVARFYARHTEVDLFKQGPLYALSRLTAQTTIGAILVVYSVASVRQYMTQPFGLVTVAAIVILAAASFLFPLLRVHQILVGEKARLLDAIADRLRTSGAELHGRIDRGQLRGMHDLNKALAGLEIEHKMIAAMPTWPWQPETFRWVLAVMILPVAIWVIQLLIQRALIP
jgi:hypothetical protein